MIRFLTNTMHDETTVEMGAIKDSFTLAIKNAEDIERLRRDYTKAISDLKTKIDQSKVQQDIVIQQSVRNSMYAELKNNNASVTKRFEDMKAMMKNHLAKNEESIKN